MFINVWKPEVVTDAPGAPQKLLTALPKLLSVGGTGVTSTELPTGNFSPETGLLVLSKNGTEPRKHA